MKKLTTTLIVFLLVGIINAQPTVPQEQKSLYGIVEATWCGNCGQYGLPVTAQVINQTASKAVFYSLHSSTNSALYSPTAQTLATAFGASGQPYWTINGTALGSYNASIQNNSINAINANYNATATDVNAGLDWYVANDTIYVETLTKFFNGVSGDYYVAVYLSEDSIYAYQANYDPNIPNGNIYHNHVLRTSFSANAFGVPVASGSITSGATYTNYHQLKINPAWNMNHIHLSVAVWKKNGPTYEFKNINGDEAMTTSINDSNNPTVDFNVFPNPSNGFLTLQFNKVINNPTFILYDLAGKIVYQENSTESESLFKNMNVSNLTAGSYLLNVTSEASTITKRIVIQ